MRWLLLLGLWGWALAQGDTLPDSQSQQSLDRCQAVFSELRPQFLYAERAGVDRFFIRVVLGRGGLPLVRMTVSLELTPVPLGLEDIAVQPRPTLDAQRFYNFVSRRFEAIMRDLNLGNWITIEPRGYRCFLLYQGRQVGVLLLNRRYEPIPTLRWFLAYQRAPFKYPAELPAPVQP